jgi:Septum formation
VWVLAIIGIIIVAVATSANRNDSGQITSGGSVSATALQPGDCVNNLKDTTSLLSLPAVPCSQAHEGEVFAVFDLPAGPYPGASAVNEQATTECSARITVYSPTAGTDGTYDLFLVYPRAQDWSRGDREIACVAAATVGTTTGSIKGR